MGNKTIYVSQKDEPLFEEAQKIAGEALSSVIARSLREFVARAKEKKEGMKEISVKVGIQGSEREQRFVGSQIGKWNGLSEDKEWLMSAKIYSTSKGNLAVLLITGTKATLLTNHKEWKKSGAYLEKNQSTDLLVAEKPEQFEGKVPTELLQVIKDVAEKEEKAVEYLDI